MLLQQVAKGNLTWADQADILLTWRVVFQVVKVGLIESGPSPTGEEIGVTHKLSLNERSDSAVDNVMMFVYAVVKETQKRAWRWAWLFPPRPRPPTAHPQGWLKKQPRRPPPRPWAASWLYKGKTDLIILPRFFFFFPLFFSLLKNELSFNSFWSLNIKIFHVPSKRLLN